MTKTISLSPHKIPKGQRVYAIGDVHGYADILKQMHEKIHQDIQSNTIEKITILHLGDYINRGPDSKGVLDFLIKLSALKNEIEYVHLLGNHENGMLEFIDDPIGENRSWDAWPNAQYLISYDINPDIEDVEELAAVIKSTVPEAHWMLKKQMPHYHVVGDFAFVHNGPRPGVKLTEQTKEDLVNNREPFMSTIEPHEYFIVHGHTSTKDFQVDVKPNRINLDTGLFYKEGVLTCGIFENSDVRFIRVDKSKV